MYIVYNMIDNLIYDMSYVFYVFLGHNNKSFETTNNFFNT